MTLSTEPAPGARTDLRDRGWFPVLVVIAVVVVFGVLVTKVVHRGTITGWTVLATCPAAAGAVPTAVSPSLDTSACATTPDAPEQTRGWPVVAAVLPPSAGIDPGIERVRSDPGSRTIVVEYRAGGAPATGDVIVYVEVPPTAVPDSPVTVTAQAQA